MPARRGMFPLLIISARNAQQPVVGRSGIPSAFFSCIAEYVQGFVDREMQISWL